jgi:hypothetical protein
MLEGHNRTVASLACRAGRGFFQCAMGEIATARHGADDVGLIGSSRKSLETVPLAADRATLPPSGTFLAVILLRSGRAVVPFQKEDR